MSDHYRKAPKKQYESTKPHTPRPASRDPRPLGAQVLGRLVLDADNRKLSSYNYDELSTFCERFPAFAMDHPAIGKALEVWKATGSPANAELLGSSGFLDEVMEATDSGVGTTEIKPLLEILERQYAAGLVEQYAAMLKHALACGDGEQVDIVRKALDPIWRTATTAAKSGITRLVLSETDMENAPPPIWLDQQTGSGGLALGEVGFLHGESGIGKSFLMGTLMLSLASGKTLFPAFEMRQAFRVASIPYEDNRFRLHPRMTAIAKHYGLDWKRLESEGMIHFILPDQMSPIFGRNTNLIDRLDAYIKANKINVLIADPLNRVWSIKSENDADCVTEAFAQITRLAEENQCAILLCHHDRKAGDEFRGSVAIKSNVRWQCHLTKDGEVGRKLVVEKNNYGPQGMTYSLKFSKEHGVLISSTEPEAVPDIEFQKAKCLEMTCEYLRLHPETRITVGGVSMNQATSQELRRVLASTCPSLDSGMIRETLEGGIRDGIFGTRQHGHGKDPSLCYIQPMDDDDGVPF